MKALKDVILEKLKLDDIINSDILSPELKEKYELIYNARAT